MNQMPHVVHLPGQGSLRGLSFRHRLVDNDSGTKWPNQFTTVTINPSSISDGLVLTSLLWAFAAAKYRERKRFQYRQEVTFSVETKQPIVVAKCTESESSRKSEDNVMSFENIGCIPDDFDPSQGSYDYACDTDPQVDSSLHTAQKFLISVSTPDVLWLDENDLRSSTESTINHDCYCAPPRPETSQSLLLQCRQPLRSAHSPHHSLRSTQNRLLESIQGVRFRSTTRPGLRSTRLRNGQSYSTQIYAGWAHLSTSQPHRLQS